MEEFRDFRRYLETLDTAYEVGICKVIPPAGWFERTYTGLDLVVESPIRQVVSGRAGSFNVDLFEISRMTVSQFESFAARNAFESDNYAERERKFWRSMGNASQWEDPIYGADMVGSLFGDDDACSWNVNNLDSILTLIGSDLPGVSNAMLYIGTWRALFAFHVEDMNLYSINYLHTGAAKSWYSVPVRYKQSFENMAESYFTTEHRQCKEFLRHKTKLFSPSKLKESGIDFSTVLQEPGEFVVTFPGAYHAGFNHGFNIAEATNFATPRWIDIGRKAKRCVCRPHSVQIDVDMLETLYLRQLVSQKGSKKKSMKRMRCVCGKNSIFDGSTNSWDPHVSACNVFRCVACHLWCHRHCVYLSPNMPTSHLVATVSPGTSSSSAVASKGAELGNDLKVNKHLLCHICYNLENEASYFVDEIVEVVPPQLVPEVTSSGRAKKRAPRLDDSSDDAYADEKMNSVTSPQPVKKSKPVVFLPPSVGDTIATILPGYVVETIGVITDIEDGLARLHVKKTKKDDDVWISLDDETCRLVESRPIVLTSKKGGGGSSRSSIVNMPPSVLPPTSLFRTSRAVSKKRNVATKKSSLSRVLSKAPNKEEKVLISSEEEDNDDGRLVFVNVMLPDQLFERFRPSLFAMFEQIDPITFHGMMIPLAFLCKLGDFEKEELLRNSLLSLGRASQRIEVKQQQKQNYTPAKHSYPTKIRSNISTYSPNNFSRILSSAETVCYGPLSLSEE